MWALGVVVAAAALDDYLGFGEAVEDLALALPEVCWLEYSFRNFDHLVEEPLRISDGKMDVPNRPGNGLTLSDAARRPAVAEVS
jgi:L-alanine-DL-glutamate epimerase-like enolase superfamily enzyme